MLTPSFLLAHSYAHSLAHLSSVSLLSQGEVHALVHSSLLIDQLTHLASLTPSLIPTCSLTSSRWIAHSFSHSAANSSAHSLLICSFQLTCFSLFIDCLFLTHPKGAVSTFIVSMDKARKKCRERFSLPVVVVSTLPGRIFLHL